MVKTIKTKFSSEFYFLIIGMAITIFIFRQTFFGNLIPFQSNLLVTFFAPWNTMRFPGWEGGIPNKPMGIDNLNLLFPYRKLSVDLIKSFIMPLWNPYNFTGNVLLADFASAIFYPLNILYFIFPLIDAWSILVIIQPVIAGIFTYYFLQSLRLKKISSFFGALTFAFSGEMIVWMGDHLIVSHTMIWLPLMLVSIEKFAQNHQNRFYFLFIFSLVSSFFAGFFQTFTYVFLVALVYALFRLYKQKKLLLKTLAACLLSLGIVSIQLLPSLESFSYSSRIGVDVGYLYDIYRMPIGHLFSFLSPDYKGNPGAYNFFGSGYHESVLYIGILPLMFALLSLRFFRKNWAIKFFAIVMVISLLIGIKISLMDWLYALRLPVFSTFLPSRIFFVTTFALAVLAGIGMDTWQIEKDKKKILKILTFFGFSIAALGTYLVFIKFYSEKQDILINQFIYGLNYLKINEANVSLKNLVPGAIMVIFSIILFLAASLVKKKYSLIAIFFLTIGSQIYFANKYINFSYKQFVYPSHPVLDFLKNHAGLNRFWTYGDGYINANFATYYKIYSPDGTDTLFPSRLGEVFYATEKKGKLASQIPRIDVRIAPAAEGRKMTENPYRLRLLSLLGVRYITDYALDESAIDSVKKFPAELFFPVYKNNGWTIYEFMPSLPRAFFTNNLTVERDPQKILDKIYQSPISSPNIVLENPPKIPIESTPSLDYKSVKITSYTPNKIEIEVDADKNSLLFLSDSFNPGWIAFVDGEQSTIERANYAFRAVAIPKGSHNVKFEYDPSSFKWGIKLSIISVILVCAIALI